MLVLQIIISKTSNMEKSLGYKPVIPWLNEGLLTSSGMHTRVIILVHHGYNTLHVGGKWRARRKMLTPAFHFNILQQFIPIFHHHASVMMEELKCLEKQGPIDVGPHLVNYTLRSICGGFNNKKTINVLKLVTAAHATHNTSLQMPKHGGWRFFEPIST